MKQLVVVVVGLALVGCGLIKTAEDTRDEVKSTNQKSEQLLNETRHLSDLTNQLIKGMQITNHGVHLQILTVALQQMMAPENTASIVPPARMMPFAETFAKEASAHEIIEVFHTYLVDLKKAPKELASARLISFTAASAIAAFTPDEKLAEIFEEQIEKGGRYAETAHVMGLLRFMFIRDYMFKSVLDTSMLNRGSLDKAVYYHDKLVYIVNLPFRAGMVLTVPDLELEGKIDAEEVGQLQTLGTGAAAKFKAKLSAETLQDLKVQGLIKSLEVPLQ